MMFGASARYFSIKQICNKYMKYKTETTIFALALVLRLILIVFLYQKVGPQYYTDAGTVDTLTYLGSAEGIVQGKGFTFWGYTSAVRTPIYPLFLSVFYLFHIPIFVVPFVQIMFASLSAVVLYRIGGLFLSPKVGLIAGILFAIEPYNLFYSTIIMSESLFILLFLLSIYSFGKWYETV